MKFLKKLFGKTNKEKLFNEKDNVGTWVYSDSVASSLTLARTIGDVIVPHLKYAFENEKDAMKAIEKLPCIKLAQDSGNLICTELLEFGVYPTNFISDDGKIFKYGYILLGNSLSYSLWEIAKKYCEEMGGQLFSEQVPSKKKIKPNLKQNVGTSSIKFIREKKTVEYGVPTIRRYYKAPNKTIALEYLKGQTITKQQYFIVIETPQGAVAKDRLGIFEQ